MMQKTKGFTLIELLVVIAIIGILSGLIIVSMSGAQNSAKDARIKSAMDQIRSSAEIYKMNNNSRYSNISPAATVEVSTCAETPNSMLAETDIDSLCDDIQGQGTGALTINIASDGSAYCMQKVLNGTTPQTWCLDSTGLVGCIGSTNCPASASIGAGCDATSFNCK